MKLDNSFIGKKVRMKHWRDGIYFIPALFCGNGIYGVSAEEKKDGSFEIRSVLFKSGQEDEDVWELVSDIVEEMLTESA